MVSDDPDKDVSHDNSKYCDTTADTDDIPRKKTLKVKRVVTRVSSEVNDRRYFLRTYSQTLKFKRVYIGKLLHINKY